MRSFLLAIAVLAIIFFVFLIGMGFGLLISGEDAFGARDRVAVLTIDDIVLDSQIYLDSISKIKKDDSIKALVVRINSPGGAVGPSQEIYGEIKELREKMPVIASLGAIGASGGYYIACGAEKILTNPGTITGSIGVIAQFVNYDRLIKWAKMDVEVIKSGQFKDAGSPFREMSEAEREYFQELIDNVHSQFKLAVSEARGIDPDEIDRIADGRVFTGEQAKDLKLVDEFGTLSDAINLAGTKGGIGEEPDVVYYPKRKAPFIDLLLSKFQVPDISGFPVKERFGLFYLVDIIR